MTSKSLLERQKKRIFLVKKYTKKRILLKNLITKTKILTDILNISECLQKLPKDSNKIRLRNRCNISGKARGFLRYFGLGQHMTRKLAHLCMLPGIIKASW